MNIRFHLIVTISIQVNTLIKYPTGSRYVNSIFPNLPTHLRDTNEREENLNVILKKCVLMQFELFFLGLVETKWQVTCSVVLPDGRQLPQVVPERRLPRMLLVHPTTDDAIMILPTTAIAIIEYYLESFLMPLRYNHRLCEKQLKHFSRPAYCNKLFCGETI